MIKIGLLGCGTVGSGVTKLLQHNQFDIAQKVGTQIEIKKVLARTPAKARALGFTDEQICSTIDDIVNDEEIQIVVELIGGVDNAFTYICKAMQNKKHVVTANKDLVASRGKELFALSEENQVDFYFEASVGGGIPIILPLKESLAGNAMQEIIGILNGTTNFILTKMSGEGLPYAEVLKQAQELGYAEADPTADVGGLDAGRKIAILASIAFNSRVTFDDVYCEGITKIEPTDIAMAKRMGYVVKLLAIAKEKDGKFQVRVHPAFLPQSHPLASVNDVFNAVYLQGDAVGEVMLYGRGAGEMPTASSVVGDIMEVCRNIAHQNQARLGCTCYTQKPIQDMDEVENKFYIRLLVADRPMVLAGIAKVFGDYDVSLDSVIQEGIKHDMAELIVITHMVPEKNLRDALQELEQKPFVDRINTVIRVEGEKEEAERA